MMKHQLHVWLTTPEFAKRTDHQSMPGNRCRNPDSKRTSLAESDPFGAALCVVDFLQNATRIAQEHLSCFAQSHSARQPFEQKESHLPLEILDLPGQRRLHDMKALGCASEVLLFSNADEIAQMAEFH
jgi:hypothetical protein